jgi:hypothetical protein
MSAFGSRFAAVVIYALIALAALALPFEASEPIHIHHGEAPAFYNAECLLATLAAFHGLGPLPAQPASVSTALVAGAAVLLGAPGAVAPILRHTDPRAPPFV